jgi:uncharacterized membrane protein YhhN
MAPRSARISLCVFAAAGLVDLAAELVGWKTLRAVARALLMPSLIGFLVRMRRSNRRHRNRLLSLTVMALVFSGLGDSFGSIFVIKMLLFLIAQISYIAALWPDRRRSIWNRPALTVAYAIVLAALAAFVVPGAGPLALPVVIYAVSLGMTATLSTGLNRVAGLGGALFAVSDSILAVDRFVNSFQIPHARFWNMLTYLAAQFLLVIGVLVAIERPRPPDYPPRPA